MTLYGIPPAAFRRAMAPADPREHARRIADTAADWWLSERGGSADRDIAVGVLAALALTARHDPRAPDPAHHLIPLDDNGLVDALRGIWNTLWRARPEAADLTSCLHQWLAKPNSEQNRALATYTRVLIREGLLEFAGDLDRCTSEDLLGLVVQRLRSRGERSQRGEFFTPAQVCDRMADILLQQGPPEGSSLVEPAAGTGGMARAAARRLRAVGLEPAKYTWLINDIDPLNSACCTVNALLWRLGPNVLICCGDALGDTAELTRRSQERARTARLRAELQPALFPTQPYTAPEAARQ